MEKSSVCETGLRIWFANDQVRQIRLTKFERAEDKKLSPGARANVDGMVKQPRVWMVDFHSDAVIDFEDVKSRGERKAVVNVVQKLKDLGPELPSPHMKSLKGEANLFELRPKQEACEARPLYARFGSRFVVLAVAAKKRDFDRAVVEARERLEHRC